MGGGSSPTKQPCSEGITQQLLGNSQHCKTRSLPRNPKGFVCFQPYLFSCFKSSQWKLLLGLCWSTAMLKGLEEFAGVWFAQRAKKRCSMCLPLIAPYYVRKMWNWVIARSAAGCSKLPCSHISPSSHIFKPKFSKFRWMNSLPSVGFLMLAVSSNHTESPYSIKIIDCWREWHTQTDRTIESLRLGKTTKIIRSNHQPIPPYPLTTSLSATSPWFLEHLQGWWPRHPLYSLCHCITLFLWRNCS